MRRRILVTTVVALIGLSGVPAAGSSPGLGRQVLGSRDGWAAATTGTTGGANAAHADVHVVSNRAELVAALGKSPDAPKIIYVRGRIDGNVDAANRPMTCDDFADPAYSLPAYLAQYDPVTWGRAPVSGPLEDARTRSQRNQEAQVLVRVGANTTIAGLGRGATLHGVALRVQGDNVILRNLRFEDAYDCFPQWDPTDGAQGAWNSEYDNLALVGASHVWVDHNEFDDGGNTDLPVHFGQKYEVHDGLFDIVNGSDLVTVSYNRLQDHDKSMLIGSTDRPTYDVGKLRVTLHHNLFKNLGQRAPRVRYGQVHVYDNFYVVGDPAAYQYSWGVGVESRIHAENNFFLTSPAVPPGNLVHYWKGTAIHATGTLLSTGSWPRAADPVAEYNAAYDPDLGTDVGWTPTLVPRLDPTVTVPALVLARAGAGHLG